MLALSGAAGIAYFFVQHPDPFPAGGSLGCLEERHDRQFNPTTRSTASKETL